MFNIVLYEPEIPPNTGNIIRLCSNSNCKLHLIKPLGFELSEKTLRRAGLDYIKDELFVIYEDYSDFLSKNKNINLFGISTKGKNYYHSVIFKPHDFFMFGPETRGLPDSIRNQIKPNHLLRVPMAESSRSINLANTVSIILYEAWRQYNFLGSI
jgi:tRNA (cytidine/uridine-2'-O-)-methyltransferase